MVSNAVFGVDSEVVYVSQEGEFIRQAFAERYRKHCGGGLPERIKVARQVATLAEMGAGMWGLDIPPDRLENALKETVFTARQFHAGRPTPITNALLADSLRAEGFRNPRRYPAVEFFVDDLFDYPSTEMSPVARNGGNRWCHLFTNGDREDLHRFASLLGLTRRDFVDDPTHWRYDITPGKRNIALGRGAREVTYDELRAIFRKRDEMSL